jgi:CxxC motif-containing protein (DUF1111 family)
MKRSQIIGWTFGISMALPFVYRAVDWWGPRGKPVDAAMAQAGKALFEHEWTPGDPLANGGDGLGPVFNANSCVACHRQGGAGGSGPFEANVNIFTVRPESNLLTQGAKSRQGVVHAQAISREFQETFGHVHPSLAGLPTLQGPLGAGGFRGTAFPQGINLSQRKTPALFGAKLIDEIPDRDIIANERIERLNSGLDTPKERGKAPLGRVSRMADGRIGRFGWKAQTVSLAEFVRAACANELGLGNPGQAQPQPLGNPGYVCVSYDLTLAQCDQLTEFINSLPRPAERPLQDPEAGRRVRAGKSLFGSVGCADCHTPDVGSVRGLYSDLLLHEMGEDLEAGGNYNDRPLDDPAFQPGTGPLPAEWRTPPLWGIARSAPYLHDGRARTLEEAIRLHGGQGSASAEQFNKLSADERTALVAFLKTLDTP